MILAAQEARTHLRMTKALWPQGVESGVERVPGVGRYGFKPIYRERESENLV